MVSQIRVHDDVSRAYSCEQGRVPVTDVAVFRTQGPHDAAIIATTHVRIHGRHHSIRVLQGYGSIARVTAQKPAGHGGGLRVFMMIYDSGPMSMASLKGSIGRLCLCKYMRLHQERWSTMCGHKIPGNINQ